MNLGIGIPNLIPGFLGPETRVVLHTENGLLGVGPRPDEDELDPDLIDAAKQPITALPGAAYFDSAASFAMIRGGHVDVAVLGALEVSAHGDIANWAVPGKDVLGVGRRDGPRRRRPPRDRDDDRDVVPRRAQGGRRVHLPAHGGRARPTSIVTELSVFRLVDGELRLTELLDGATVDDVAAVTTAPFVVALEESHVS